MVFPFFVIKISSVAARSKYLLRLDLSSVAVMDICMLLRRMRYKRFIRLFCVPTVEAGNFLVFFWNAWYYLFMRKNG